MANLAKEAKTAANRSNRISGDLARKAKCRLHAPCRLRLRKRGALARIDRRILAASESQRVGLQSIRVTVAAAYVAAGGA